jgi:hypothetical protein
MNKIKDVYSCHICVSFSLKKKRSCHPDFLYFHHEHFFPHANGTCKQRNSQTSIGNFFFGHEHINLKTFLASNQGPPEQPVTQSHSTQRETIKEHNGQVPSTKPEELVPQFVFTAQIVFHIQ